MKIYGIELKTIKDDKYKYELMHNYIIHTKFRPVSRIVTPYIELGTDGLLLIKKSYRFDGPSGISFDTDNFMRGSLVHDALYQLMDEGELGIECRYRADKLLYRIIREDGMWLFRASYIYRFVRIFGGMYVKRKVKPS